jgi:hypothetical protein
MKGCGLLLHPYFNDRSQVDNICGRCFSMKTCQTAIDPLLYISIMSEASVLLGFQSYPRYHELLYCNMAYLKSVRELDLPIGSEKINDPSFSREVTYRGKTFIDQLTLNMPFQSEHLTCLLEVIGRYYLFLAHT